MVFEGANPEPELDHSAVVADVLARLGLQALGDAEPVADSVVNLNFRVETSAGALFVRIYKEGRALERVLNEQRAAAFAGERGVPVIAPLATRDGQTAWESHGRWVCVYPFVEGGHLRRGTIRPEGARVLGRLQGRLHRVLADLPSIERPNHEMNWDTETSIAALSRVDDLIRYYPAPSEDRLRAQKLLRDQLAMLESDLPRPASDFQWPRLQPVHGDYHDRNVLIGEGNEVVAVLDWERVSLYAPGFEVLRALSFMQLTDADVLAPYLTGYAEEARIPAEESALAVEAWWQSAMHNTWAFTEVFIRGDPRPAQFFEEGAEQLRKFSDADFRRWMTDEMVRIAGSR